MTRPLSVLRAVLVVFTVSAMLALAVAAGQVLKTYTPACQHVDTRPPTAHERTC